MKQPKEKNKKSLNSLVNFIKYHNAFAIAVSLVAAGMGLTFAASPEIRQDVAASLISAKETVRSIDNTYIVGVDLANFDFGLQITDIKEDNDSYYISYAFKTIYIKDYVWQELSKEATLTITKQGLEDRDLGLYVAEQLSEVINYQLSYLKEVQRLEKQKGASQKVVAIEYAGLVGKFLSPKEKTFPGYEPVIPEETPQTAAAPPVNLSPTETAVSGSQPLSAGVVSPEMVAVQIINNRALIEEIVQKAVKEYLEKQQNQATETPAPTESPLPSPEPVEGPVPAAPTPDVGVPDLTSGVIESAAPAPSADASGSPAPAEPSTTPDVREPDLTSGVNVPAEPAPVVESAPLAPAENAPAPVVESAPAAPVVETPTE